MKKKHKYGFFFFLLFFLFSLFAEVPADYYNLAKGKKALELRTSLYKSIKKGHKRLKYDDLWWLYAESDTLHLPNGDVRIWDLYSTRGDKTADHYFNLGKNGGQCGGNSPGTGEGVCYEREHSVPYSWFAPPKEEGKTGRYTFSFMYTDAFHLYPVDRNVNKWKSNHPLGEVGLNPITTSLNGSKLGGAKEDLGYENLGSENKVFEPIDAYKGDLARTYFYMAVRYQDLCENWRGGMFGAENNGFQHWAIKMLLDWHRNDPVSTKEKNRNKVVSKYQKNRNPFVDYPELVEFIWGDKKEAVWKGLGEQESVKNNLLFKETFDGMYGKGGTDGYWGGGGVATSKIDKLDIESLSEGFEESLWEFEGAFYRGNECIRLGAATKKGLAKTPRLGLSGNAVLEFKAGAWGVEAENTMLKLKIVGGGALSQNQVTLSRGEFKDYSLDIIAGNTNTQIQFEGEAENNSRFFLDDIVVSKTGSATTGIPDHKVISILYATVGEVHFEAKPGERIELYNPIGLLLYKGVVRVGLNSIKSPQGVVFVRVGTEVEKVFVK